jgi:hypothetical protein
VIPLGERLSTYGIHESPQGFNLNARNIYSFELVQQLTPDAD